jgi:hypothetical protein
MKKKKELLGYIIFWKQGAIVRKLFQKTKADIERFIKLRNLQNKEKMIRPVYKTTFQNPAQKNQVKVKRGYKTSMPGVSVRKIPRSKKYRVRVDGRIAAQGTTKKKAFAQARLLRGLQHGMIPRKNPADYRPKKPIEIYGRLLRIEAKKGPGHVCDSDCKKANHAYYHDFSRHAKVYGMPDGSLRITDKT